MQQRTEWEFLSSQALIAYVDGSSDVSVEDYDAACKELRRRGFDLGGDALDSPVEEARPKERIGLSPTKQRPLTQQTYVVPAQPIEDEPSALSDFEKLAEWLSAQDEEVQEAFFKAASSLGWDPEA